MEGGRGEREEGRGKWRAGGREREMEGRREGDGNGRKRKGNEGREGGRGVEGREEWMMLPSSLPLSLPPLPLHVLWCPLSGTGCQMLYYQEVDLQWERKHLREVRVGKLILCTISLLCR